MTFVAFQIAANTRVGNLVGAKNTHRLPHAVLSGVLIALVFAALVSFVLQFFGHQLLSLWSNDAAILRKTEHANIGIVLAIPPYAVMICLIGVMRGAGLQFRAA